MFVILLCLSTFFIQDIGAQYKFSEGEFCKMGSVEYTCQKTDNCLRGTTILEHPCQKSLSCCKKMVTNTPPVRSASLKNTKSKRMCKEYAKAVFSEIESPILSGGEGTERIDECAMLSSTLIINGEDAAPKEFPHMALIGHGNFPIVWRCGGSLISERWIVSAAHCTATSGTLANWALLGDLKVLSDDDYDTSSPLRVAIQRRINHPLFDIKLSNTRKVYHDIALYELKDAVKFNPYIRPICLHTEHEIKDNFPLATGWGKTEHGNESLSLKKVNLGLMKDPKACHEKYIKTQNRDLLARIPNGINDQTMICAYSKGKDTCKGDSGGPLQIVLNEPYCMYAIIGITSFGEECATDYPGVYTRVSHYVPWIESYEWP